MRQPVFVYDGDCAFCSSCARFIERRIPSPATVVPWQFADLDDLGLSMAQVEEAVQWVGPDGTVASGPDAIALLLQDAGRLWTVPGRALRFGPVRLAAWPAYRWIADHRHLLPGGTAACSLPVAQRPAAH
ncbi:thiol-disulfide oxidoreductase DCC family protein [Mangrovihabitans endophyticus]|uniref:thiol-disulfide oxidoreductase DCC family protein n=1 Tax=Mangrovihabitans endophyticus TaxID=1751298 RepID=UPI00166DB677|nr:DCC1-like thiol-disulfide oxidoreductase family protein [Mangrovihabitans endophyticus]